MEPVAAEPLVFCSCIRLIPPGQKPPVADIKPWCALHDGSHRPGLCADAECLKPLHDHRACAEVGCTYTVGFCDAHGGDAQARAVMRVHVLLHRRA